jgi:integrase
MEKEEAQNNAVEPRVKRENKVNKYYLSLEELNKIIDAAESLRDRVILKVLIRTGVRRFELCNLLVKDINFENKSLFIAHGKGNKQRSVPVDEDTLKEIKFYLDRRRYGKLIQSNNKANDGIDESRINIIVSKTAEKAGIKNPDPTKKHLNPHIFRHSFVRNMIKLGLPQSYVQEIAGHSSITTTIGMYGKPGERDVNELYQEKIKEFSKK